MEKMDYKKHIRICICQEEAFRHSGAKDDVYHGGWQRESEYIKGL